MLSSLEKYLVPLTDCNAGMSSIVGGKAANLGEVARLGIRCPSGLVLSTKAFKAQCSMLGIESVVANLSGFLDDAVLRTVRDNILGTNLPSEVAEEVESVISTLPSRLLAVRSSATAEDSPSASFAGMFETELGVRKDRDAVFEAIKKCWASIFSASTAGYLSSLQREGRLPSQQIAMAVIIQSLVPAKVSGVAVTSLPGVRDVMLIEAGYGVGTVVDGADRHDKYFIHKHSGRLLRTIVCPQKMERLFDGDSLRLNAVSQGKSDQTKLPEDVINQIIQTALSIESHFGLGQNIEFAVVDKDVWITQSRPLPRHAFSLPATVQSLCDTW